MSLFEEISMPIYGIAHPKCFDSTGEWTGNGCPSASGQYRIVSMTPEKLVLKSRHVFPENKNAPEEVEIYSPTATERNLAKALLHGKGELASQSSLDLGTELTKELSAKKFSVVSEPALRMHFVQLNHKRGVFMDKPLRQSIRDSFLNILDRNSDFKSQTELNPSFVPKGGMGYLQFNIPKEPPARDMDGQVVEMLVTPLPEDTASRGYQVRMAAESAVTEALKAGGLAVKITRCNGGKLIERRQKGEFDIVLLASGLSIYDPYCGLRMMFMSKIGAEIPDPSGQIPGLIEAAEATEDPVFRKKTAEKINAGIFDEAAVITYATSGYIYVYAPGVDLSRINLFSDPVEFRAIGWNPGAAR